MIDFLNITNKERKIGSYYRNTYRSDTIYTFYDYKGDNKIIQIPLAYILSDNEKLDYNTEK